MKLGLVAGEASGDLIASLMLVGLRERWPDLQAFGMGGPDMDAVGFQSWWPSSKLGIFGYLEALMNLRELLRVRKQLGTRLIEARPAAFVGIDAPDFNFGLEKRLRDAGIKTVHFVCPSIWAWRAGRVETIKRSADHVLCLFPFEPELLHAHGIAATYVGHPLADKIPLEVDQAGARAALGLPADAEIVALLPGSRRSEIRYIAPTMLAAAALMQQQRPSLRFVLPAAPGMRALLAPLLTRHPELQLSVVDGRSHEVLAACDTTLVSSGTATLEAALFGRPMVVAYKVHPVVAWRLRGRNQLPWVALPNVLAREFLVPELLQEACTPEALAAAGLAWFDDPARRARVQAAFAAQHQTLRQDCAKRCADAIAQVVDDA
ncbi:MAG: lipid-A-disaccharide synthase [Paucibacter sp.]|nr:lipid-A-disaccharide synthase [Roseateles sp.]